MEAEEGKGGFVLRICCGDRLVRKVMGWPEWNGNDIAVLSIHRPRSVPRRLDVFPFLILYASIAAYFVRSMPSQFTASLICVTAVLLHILVFLVQHWSLAARVGIGYWRVTSIGGKDEDMIKSGKIRVRAVPPPYKGKAEFEKLECDGKRIHFSFQRRVYEYNRETGKFEMVRSQRSRAYQFYCTDSFNSV